MQTENEGTAKCYQRLLKEVYGADTEIKCGGSKTPTFVATVKSEADRLKILASVDFGIYGGFINRECFSRECCVASFVRGAFLACGHLSNPEKSYRLDFPVKYENLASELVKLLSEHYITAHISKRASGYVVYIKKSEMIINLLTLIGASSRSLEFIETTIIKSVKNNTNRVRNCDSANIGRTVEASVMQRKAIEFLTKTYRLESLPDELISTAKLRIENPSATLKELCALSPEPITVSGLNHRLQRIIAIYKEQK